MSTPAKDASLNLQATRIVEALNLHGHDGCTATARAFNWLGGTDVIRFIYTNGNASTYTNRIVENDPGMMSGLIQTNSSGTEWELDTPSNHAGMFSKYNDNRIPFRKIKGKTAEEVVTKFIKWLENNCEAIKARGV